MDGKDLAVGLVVGAGGPTGGAFIDSALEALTERTGWDPGSAKRIVGTSAGAFVAARIKPRDESTAADTDSSSDSALETKSAVETDSPAETLWALNNVDDMKTTIFTKALRGGRLLGGRVFALLAPPERDKALYGVPEPPYHPGASVVTVEHTWGVRHEHNLSENEDLAEAMIRASAAIPFKNGPIDIDGKLHADGAVHSANNVDLLDPTQCPLIVVISPMVPFSDGSKVSHFHRAQLFEELKPWSTPERAAVVIMPTGDEHKNRHDREAFGSAGTRAVERIFS